MNGKEEPFSEWAKALKVKRPASRLCVILEDIRLAFLTGGCSGNNRTVDVQMAVLPLVSSFTELLREGEPRVVKGVLECLKEVCTLLSSDGEDASVVASHVLSIVTDATEAGLGQSKTEVRAAAHTFLFTLATVRMECKPELQEAVVVKVLSCCVRGHKNSLVRSGALSLMEALMNSDDSECTSSHNTTNTTLVKSPSAWKLVAGVIIDGLEDPSSEVKAAARSLAVKLQLPQISVVHSAGGFKARKAGTGELRTESSHFDPFEALSPIQPVPVTSEKHLFRELEPIKIALNHESDWQGWVTALRKLAGLSLGVMMRDATKLDLPQSFVSAVRGEGLHDAAAVRITDLRSAVCREACFAVTCMANSLGGEISAPLAETWLTAALRNATSVKEVMSASASAAVREIILSASPGGSPRLVPILLDGMKAKAHAMRAQCAHGICLALSHWDPKVLEAANKQGCCATDVLAKALSDADQGVRLRARVAYFICQRCIPAFSDTISANIHPSTKRHLLNDRSTEIEAKELVAAGCEGGERNTEEQRCLPNQPLLPDVKTRMQQPTVPHIGRRRVGRGAVRAVATLNDDNNKHQQHNLNLHLPPQRVTMTKQQLRGGGGGGGHDYVTVDSVPHTPAPAIRIRDKQQQHVISSALRVVPGINSSSVALREDTIVSRSSSNPILSNPIGPQQAASRSDSADTTTASSASNLNTGTSKRAFQQEVEKCLIGCGDKHWAVRRESLEQLQALLSSSSGKEIALEGHCGRKFLLRLGEACEDSNHLCALCGLELLHALLPYVNHSSLGSLFPRVFVHLGSVKGGLRATATSIIETVRQSIEPAQLCAVICPRILDPPPEKARVAMVEFITGITPLAESYFKLPSNLRAYIARLATMLGNAGSGHSSVTAARKGLKVLYCLDCEGVINAVVTLPHSTQKAAKGVIAGFSEGIQQQQKERQEQEQYHVQEQLHVHLQPLQEKVSQQTLQPQSAKQNKQQQKPLLAHKQLPHMQTQGSQQPTEEGLSDPPEGTQHKQRHEQSDPVPCAQEKNLQQQPENREQQQSKKRTTQQQRMPPFSIRQPLSCSIPNILPQEIPLSHLQPCKDQVSSVGKTTEQQVQLHLNKKRMESDNKAMLGTVEDTNLNLSVKSMMFGFCANASTRERVTALKVLRLVTTNNGVTFWKQYFFEVLTLLLNSAKGNDMKLHGSGGDGVDENNPNPPPCTTITSKEEIHRSKLVQGIRCLIAHQGTLFLPHTEFVVGHLLDLSTLTSSPLVRAESLAALHDLINVLDSSRYMQCLLHRMHPRHAAATQEVGGPSYSTNARNESLEIFISLIPVLPFSVLLGTLHGSLLPGALDEAFNTKDDMATRQLAVKAYVVMYKSLGSDLDMFMAGMPVHRQKLIHIYIDKDAQSITTGPPST